MKELFEKFVEKVTGKEFMGWNIVTSFEAETLDDDRGFFFWFDVEDLTVELCWHDEECGKSYSRKTTNLSVPDCADKMRRSLKTQRKTVVKDAR